MKHPQHQHPNRLKVLMAFQHSNLLLATYRIIPGLFGLIPSPTPELETPATPTPQPTQGSNGFPTFESTPAPTGIPGLFGLIPSPTPELETPAAIIAATPTPTPKASNNSRNTNTRFSGLSVNTRTHSGV